MTDAQAIARGLTEAQREALLGADVREPHSFMPTYWAVEFKCRGDGSVVQSLADMGLVTLPIRLGNRGSTWGYTGEILPLGREVRSILTSQDTDK